MHLCESTDKSSSTFMGLLVSLSSSDTPPIQVPLNKSQKLSSAKCDWESSHHRSWVYPQPVLRLDLLNERDNRIAYSLDALRLLSGIDFRPYLWLLAEVEPGFTITNLECADPDVDCGQDLDGNQNTRLRLDRGQRTGFNLGSQITVDFRNSPFNPSRGWSLRFGTEYASGIVQDQGVNINDTYAFLKSEGRLTGYLPLGDSVLALALWGGRIDVLDGTEAPIDQRFFLGGRRTLRGFFR